MYNDKAIDKLIEWAKRHECPNQLGLRIIYCTGEKCDECWKQALSTEPEGDNG